MKAIQKTIFNHSNMNDVMFDFQPDIILLFISPGFESTQEILTNLTKAHPKTTITGCSTSGEIYDTSVNDNSVVINAIQFDKTSHRLASVNIKEVDNSFDAGLNISNTLSQEDLRHVLIFSDGLTVNGAELVKGLEENLNNSITVTGGLAGDGTDFKIHLL